MQHTLFCPPLSASQPEPAPVFNVVIAYEDFETGKHAKKTYDFLVENLGRDCRPTSQMWKFDVLGIPKLREIAVKDAAAADIIIISSHGEGLPEPLKAWIESWLMDANNCLALVALFDRPSEEPVRTRAARAYLAEVAKRGKMEFFAQPDEWPSRHSVELPDSHRGSERSGKTLSALAGVVQRDIPMPHWGINE